MIRESEAKMVAKKVFLSAGARGCLTELDLSAMAIAVAADDLRELDVEENGRRDASRNIML